MRKLLTGAFLALGTWLLAACTPPPADVVFVVTTTLDTIDANIGDGTCADSSGDCSLRAAVMESNAAPDTNEIQLTGGQTYTLTIAGAGEDAAATGDLDLNSKIYVRAVLGSGQAVIDGNGLDRVFHGRSGFGFLEGLDITGGDVSGLSFPHNEGGGVMTDGMFLGIEDTRIHGNSANNGGGIAANSTGYAWIEDSTIDGNSAVSYGGGTFGRSPVRLQHNVTVDGNTSGLFNNVQLHQESGPLFVNYSTVTTDVGVAFLLQNGDATVSSSIVSGAVADCTLVGTGSVTSVGVVWSDSTCSPGPGDVVESQTLLEPLADNGGPVPTRMPFNVFPFVDGLSTFDPACTAQAFDARQQPRPFGNGCDVGAVEAQADEAPDLFVVDTTSDTTDVSVGDGVCEDGSGNCSLRAAVMEANNSSNRSDIELTGGSTYTLSIAGAGEDAAATGDLDITDDTTITVSGAGQATVDANSIDRVFEVLGGSVTMTGIDITGGDVSGATGGGMRIANTAGVTLTKTRVTGNTSTGSGGGVANAGALMMRDSTIDANTSSAGFGGGLFQFTGVADLFHVTLDGNQSSGNDSEIAVEAGDLVMKWSTVNGGAGSALDLFSGTSDLITSGFDGGCILGAGHTVTQTIGNVWSDSVCDNGFGSLINTPINVAALADNGGPVPTMMPNIGSALLDNISFFDPSCVANPVDARGTARPQNGNCDIGAVEALVGEPA